LVTEESGIENRASADRKLSLHTFYRLAVWLPLALPAIVMVVMNLTARGVRVSSSDQPIRSRVAGAVAESGRREVDQ